MKWHVEVNSLGLQRSANISNRVIIGYVNAFFSPIEPYRINGIATARCSCWLS